MKSSCGKLKVGAVLLVVRNGKIVTFDAIGFEDRAEQTPMQKDSIFRIASMSKPITTAAAMILAEENKLDVGAPVALYLSEFKDVKVGPERAAVKRPITVQDLMRHTSGLYGGLAGGFGGNAGVEAEHHEQELRRAAENLRKSIPDLDAQAYFVDFEGVWAVELTPG